ncbi:MAG: type IV pilin [Halodesulfurarchaeum sp.]
MTRAVSPVIGTTLLVLITLLLAATVTATVGVGAIPDVRPEYVSIDARASPDGTVTLTHESGTAIDVREITVRVSVNGKRLEQQPPVPFFSSTGFEPGPTGPFNSAADPQWSVGERVSFTIRETNAPGVEPGDEITVTMYEGRTTLAVARTTVSGPG